MRVLPLGDHVVEAIKPSSLTRLRSRVRDDLRITLTVVKYAETMSQLGLFRGTTLTRLDEAETSDFHYGTDLTGVVLRPIDNNGSQLAVDHTSTSLSAVSSVAIVAVGPTLEEATSA